MPPDQSPRAPQVTGEDAVANVGPFLSYLENFHRRVMQDALTEATGSYWLQRAATLDNAVPSPGDYTGLATDDDLDLRRRELQAVVLACRQRAAVASYTHEADSLVLIDLCLREVGS
jgi:hypothetical protein